MKNCGLIKTKRVGLGKPNKIYINSFDNKENSNSKDNKNNCKTSKDANKNNNKSFYVKRIFNNNIFYNKYKKYFSEDEKNKYLEEIKKNIEYENLKLNIGYRKDILDEIVEIMANTIASRKEFITISGEKVSLETIKNKFLKINYQDMEYVLECLRENSTRIRNIKAYIITTLFNAKFINSIYYENTYNYDKKQNYLGVDFFE